MTTDHPVLDRSAAPGVDAPAQPAAGAASRDVRPTPAASWGLLLLRVVLGVTFVLLGWQKVSEWGMAGTAESFEGMGVPAPAVSAVLAAAVELLGGLALVLGVLIRTAGVLLALDMVGALVLVHASAGFFAADGGVEYVLVLAAAALALALTGPGRYALAGPFPTQGAGRYLAWSPDDRSSRPERRRP